MCHGGPACRGPRFGWTSPDREIKSLSQRCERIELNLGGSLILGCVIRWTYFGLILMLDLHVFDMSQLSWPGGTIQLRAASAQEDRPAWSEKILISF